VGGAEHCWLLTQPDLVTTPQTDLADATPDPRRSTVLVPYPAGTRLPTQWPCWLDSACAHLGPVALVVRTDGSRTVDGLNAPGPADGVARSPLVARGASGALTIPGALETGEPADLAWHDEGSAGTLARALARQPRPLDLPRLPLGSPSLQALTSAFRGRGWVRMREAHGSPYIELDARWTQPLHRFNNGRQSDFRRAQRRAEQAGELSFEVHAPAPGLALDQLMNEAYDVESRGWKGEEGTALALDPLLGPFYRRLAQAAAQAGLLRLCFLRIAGQAAAMQLALQGEGRFWLMKIGYDAAYARCSPGQLLMLHTIGHAAAQGLSSYEMLGNAAAWTAGWTRTLRPFVQVRAYPASWLGARTLCADASRAAWTRWRAWSGQRKTQATQA
jgi:hypothetical protein